MALQVVRDFEHAAVEKARVASDGGRVLFAAPLGESPRGMWFHFQVAGGDGSDVTFVLTNRDQMLGGPNFERSVPVFRHEGGDWQRVDPQSCQAGEPDPGLGGSGLGLTGGSFQFKAPCGPGLTEVAFCYPYTLAMIDEALERWARHRSATVLTLGRSGGGRPLRVLRIGTPSRGKKVIWLLARQHAGEVSGSYAAEGFVDAVLGKGQWAASLRRRAVLYVCPAVDVDGVAEGLYGKDRAPVDFNRDWSANPQRAEIRALRKEMEAARVKCAGPDGEMLAVIDLHAPSPGDVSFPVPPHPAWAGEEAWRRVWWLAKLLERYGSDAAPVRWANSWPEHIDWYPTHCGPTTSNAFHAAGQLARHSCTIELTYHWQANNRLVTREDWARVGQSLARTTEALARGVKPPGNANPPEPPFHLPNAWAWVRVPRQCNARVNDQIVSIQADGSQAYAALLFGEPIPIGRGRFTAAASLYRTSHRKCPVQRLIYFFHKGIFTGEVVEQKNDLGSQGELRWRGPTKRKRPADAAYLAVVLRNWLGTITIARPERTLKG